MTEILQNLHFIRPQFLWFLIPALFSAFLLFRKNSQSGNWKSVISPELLPHLLISPKKEAKKKARLEQRRARRAVESKNDAEDKMHDIDKPITLEDLTNPDKK